MTDTLGVFLVQAGNNRAGDPLPDADVIALGIAGYGGGHMGLAYLASVLRGSGIQVTILDALSCPMAQDEIVNRVVAARPHAVGFTAMDSNLEATLEVAAAIRRRLPDVPIMLGGHEATFTHERLARNDDIAVVVKGEAEHLVTELVERLVAKQPLDHIPGLSWQQGGTLFSTPINAPPADLDMFPFPARDSYFHNLSRGVPAELSMMTSRGCPSFCTFCDDAQYYRLGAGPVWRARSPKNVVDELEYLVRETAHDFVFSPIDFFDPNYFGHGADGIARAVAIAEEILRRDIDVCYSIACRAEDFVTVEDAHLDTMERSGLCSVFIGVESGAATGLKLFGKGKGTTPDVSRRSQLRLVQRGLRLRHMFGFIMFHPLGDLNGLRQDAEFLESIHSSPIMHANRLNLTAGTPIVKMTANRGLLRQVQRDAGFAFTFADSRVERVDQELRRYTRTAFVSGLDALRTKLPTWSTILAKRCSIWPDAVGAINAQIEALDALDRRAFRALIDHVERGVSEPVDWQCHVTASRAMARQLVDVFCAFLAGLEPSDTIEKMRAYSDRLRWQLSADKSTAPAARREACIGLS